MRIVYITTLVFLLMIPKGILAQESVELQPSGPSSIDTEFPPVNPNAGKTTHGLKRKIINFYVWGSVMIATGIPITILGIYSIRNRSEEDELDSNEPSDLGPELITGFGAISIAGGITFVTLATIFNAKYKKRKDSSGLQINAAFNRDAHQRSYGICIAGTF